MIQDAPILPISLQDGHNLYGFPFMGSRDADGKKVARPIELSPFEQRQFLGATIVLRSDERCKLTLRSICAYPAGTLSQLVTQSKCWNDPDRGIHDHGNRVRRFPHACLELTMSVYCQSMAIGGLRVDSPVFE
jgi:hypothetical protein